MFPKQHDPLQVMSHAVVGFPNLTENEQAIDGLVAAGVNLIELQVPFSDPVADGHTLVNACYAALQQGGSVRATLALAKTVSAKHPNTSFVLMSYLNPLYRYGLEQLFTDAAAAGIKGLIIPDMPVEQFEPYIPLLDELGIAPILMVTPNTSDERLERIAASARGMLYVVSRMGVTGKQTQWGDSFKAYIERIRRFTDLPLAVGFGVQAADDLKALTGVAEVAAFCSKYIEWQRDTGSEQAAKNMRQLLLDAKLVK
ncbi:tryptophan synthase subunit alpha [Nitrincola sp.]|uniref:tryptophan synthase subunit alpha n=1 Tax=Nitrincola sp. TaxID=1926584 RepID=UPI003A8DDD5C